MLKDIKQKSRISLLQSKIPKNWEMNSKIVEDISEQTSDD